MSPTLQKAYEEGRDELTPDEALAFLNEQTQQYLDMSLDEFRRQAEAGTLPSDNAMVVHIALLAGVELHHC